MVFSATVARQKENVVKSPNEKIEVAVSIGDGGTQEFTLLYEGKLVMNMNCLGIIRQDADFSKRLQLNSISTMEEVEDHYTLLHRKKGSMFTKPTGKFFLLRTMN